jgi:hypothetical protein
MNMNVAHMNFESNDPVARLTPPIIDKISFTVPVTEHTAQAHLVGRIEDYLRDRAMHALPYGHKAKYAYAVSVPLSSSATLIVQAAPTRQYKQGSAFARLELNPVKAGVIGMRDVAPLYRDAESFVRVRIRSEINAFFDEMDRNRRAKEDEPRLEENSRIGQT